MSPRSSSFPSILELFTFALVLPSILTYPVPETTKTYYELSVESLRLKNCEMPPTIDLPFIQTPEPDLKTFDFLSSPLRECQTPKAIKDDEEAHFLCKEIFEVLHNITCLHYNTTLPRIRIPIREDVCKEFKAMKDVLPKQNEYLSGKLVDSVICKLLCAKNFSSLCQYLLWSYNVQEQIGNVLENKPKEVKKEVNEIGLIKKDNGDVGDEPEQQPILEEKNNIGEEPFDNGNDDFKTEEKTVNNIVALKNLVPNNFSNSEIADQKSPQNNPTTKVSNDIKNKNLTSHLNYVNDASLERQQNTAIPGDKVELLETNNENYSTENNKVAGIQESKPKDSLTKTNVKEIPETAKESKNKVAESETLQDTTKVKSTTISNTFVKKNDTVEVPVPLKPKEKELNSVNFKDEKEPETQENLPKPVISDKFQIMSDKVMEKSKEDVLNKIIFDTQTLELTTVQISLEEEPEDKETEQYFKETNEIPKKSNAPKTNIQSEAANSHGLPKDYDMLLSRNNFGRSQEGIIPTFPEQEDGHFFFYLLSIVLILMAGYLLFHNKQKILALIVEGRHERRRRSHGSGYKKLETK